MNHEAVVLGATGLVGSHIVDQLLADPSWTRVIAFGRRTTGKRDRKLVEHVVDLADVATWGHLAQGDVAFSALGTTLKAAGAKDAQWQVDHDFQLSFATVARANGVPTFVLISSAGANPNARLFYPRMKGQLEREVGALEFPRARFLRPSFLDGERSERRFGESVALGLLRPLKRILPAMARPVEASVVAAAAIASAYNEFGGVRVLEAMDIFALGGPKTHFPADMLPEESHADWAS